MTEREELLARAHEAINPPKPPWRAQLRANPVKFFLVLAAVLIALSLTLSQVNTFIQSRTTYTQSKQIGPELERLRSRGDCRAEINAASAVAQGQTILALGDYDSTVGELVEALAKTPRDPQAIADATVAVGPAAERLASAKALQSAALDRQAHLVELCTDN